MARRKTPLERLGLPDPIGRAILNLRRGGSQNFIDIHLEPSGAHLRFPVERALKIKEKVLEERPEIKGQISREKVRAELSVWAERMARAFMLPEERRDLPWDELTDEEQERVYSYGKYLMAEIEEIIT